MNDEDWTPTEGDIVWDAAWDGTHETNPSKKEGVKHHEIVSGVPRPQARVTHVNEDEQSVLMWWMPGGPDVHRKFDEISLVPEEFRRHRSEPQPMAAYEEAPGPDEFEKKWVQVIRCVGPEGGCQLKLGPLSEEREVTAEELEQARKFYKGAFDADPEQTSGATLPYMPQEDGEEGLHH